MVGIKAREIFSLLGIFFMFTTFSTPAFGQQEPGAKDDGAEELAKKTQNPVADLISVPFQSNWNFSAGFHHNRRIYVLNIQPVIPIKLSDDWNLITRIIMPVIDQHALSPLGACPSNVFRQNSTS